MDLLDQLDSIDTVDAAATWAAQACMEITMLRAAMAASASRLRYLADSIPEDEIPIELHAMARELEDAAPRKRLS